MSGECEFYKCSICGNIVEMVQKGGGELLCCGKPMKKLISNTEEAATEKHIPVAQKKGNMLNIKVGSVAHPMAKEHYIQWIYLLGNNRSWHVDLKPEDQPEANFAIGDEKIIAAYAYCNLHGLWKVDLDYLFEEIVCSPEFSQGCK